jgi:hypothetical protein
MAQGPVLSASIPVSASRPGTPRAVFPLFLDGIGRMGLVSCNS